MSGPFPVLVSVCGKYTVPPGATVRDCEAVRVWLYTCATVVCTKFEVAVRETPDESV